nr:MAG TPA: hypothetical protein [Caudoviricetes sp.]
MGYKNLVLMVRFFSSLDFISCFAHLIIVKYFLLLHQKNTPHKHRSNDSCSFYIF